MEIRLKTLEQHLTCSQNSIKIDNTKKQKRVCLIFGAGIATGSAIALKFSKEGFIIAAVRRNQD